MNQTDRTLTWVGIWWNAVFCFVDVAFWIGLGSLHAGVLAVVHLIFLRRCIRLLEKS